MLGDFKSNPLNPLKKINEEIFSFAALKQKEIDELKKMEAFRREFIADVSHELKTSVSAINLSVSLLTDDKEGGLKEEQRELLQMIEKQTGRLLNIVNQTKEFAG